MSQVYKLTSIGKEAFKSYSKTSIITFDKTFTDYNQLTVGTGAFTGASAITLKAPSSYISSGTTAGRIVSNKIDDSNIGAV